MGTKLPGHGLLPLIVAVSLILANCTLAVARTPTDEASHLRRGSHEVANTLRGRARTLAPITSLFRLADWYNRRNKPEKAAEIYLFALVRAPDNPRLLRGIVETLLQLNRVKEALPYANRLEIIAPQDPFVRGLVNSLGDRLAESKSPSTPTSSAAATLETTSVDPTIRTTTPTEQATRSDKLRALRIMKALAAAIRTYDANHPKEPMKELDINLLVEDKSLPANVDLHPYTDKLTLVDGKITVEGVGSLTTLATELEGFKTDLARYHMLVGRGELPEALDAAEALAEKYPDEAGLLFAKLATLVSMKRDKDATELARRLVLHLKSSPRPLFELLSTQYRTGDFEGAETTNRLLNEKYPNSHWAKLGCQVCRLIDRDVSYDLLSTLLEARARVLLSLEKTPESTGEAVDEKEQVDNETHE